MTKYERIAYRQGMASRRKGEPAPRPNPAEGMDWAFYLGWTNFAVTNVETIDGTKPQKTV